MRGDANTRPGFSEALLDDLLAGLWTPSARRRTHPLLVGVSGLQGIGKSTLARQLREHARGLGIACEALSLDDFYLGRRARMQLARTIHPLLTTRGVPGTHELPLLESTLAALARASPASPARLPRFDKGRDTRLPPSRWRRVTQAPRLVLLEGWCVGIPPQSAAALRRPCNRLERDEDPDGRWRRWVDARLSGDYAVLWRRLDRLLVLQAPSFACARRWRARAERALHARGASRAMDEPALARFFMHYERLSRHALATLPARAEVCAELDGQRAVRAIRARPGSSE